MTFVDITIVPVSTERRARYLDFSRRMAAVYRDHGATRVVDYLQADGSTSQDDFHADGVSYDPAELQGIAQVAGARDGESVVVTVTEWASREARDRGNDAATRDPRVLATLDEEPVFDGARVRGGSFEMTMSVGGSDGPTAPTVPRPTDR